MTVVTYSDHSEFPLELVENLFSFLPFFQMMSSDHLTCVWLLQVLVVFLKPCLVPAGPVQPLNGSECTAKGPASYLLVFTGHWSPQAFPKQYPLFRPPAQWSKLMGKNQCCEQGKGLLRIQGEISLQLLMVHFYWLFCEGNAHKEAKVQLPQHLHVVSVASSGDSVGFISF